MVDGAGGGHSTAVLRYDGEVGGSGIVGHVELRLVVAHGVRGVVGDALPQAAGEPWRRQVVDHLWTTTEGLFTLYHSVLVMKYFTIVLP